MHMDVLSPPAQPCRTDIVQDAIEPGRETRFPFKTRQCTECSYECILKGFLCFLAVLQHPHCQGHAPVFVTINKLCESLLFPCEDPLNERNVSYLHLG